MTRYNFVHVWYRYLYQQHFLLIKNKCLHEDLRREEEAEDNKINWTLTLKVYALMLYVQY